MTIQDLQQTILQEPEKCIISSDASDLALTLAGIYDLSKAHHIRFSFREAILNVFSFKTVVTYNNVVTLVLSLSEAVYDGNAYIDMVSKHGRASILIENLAEYLDRYSPEGYRFRTEGNEIGWFADLEPLTLQHVRTWMHNQVPSKRYNHASPTDALYLLDTLYAWKDKGIPVPEKYIDCMQTIVNSHEEGDGL